VDQQPVVPGLVLGIHGPQGEQDRAVPRDLPLGLRLCRWGASATETHLDGHSYTYEARCEGVRHSHEVRLHESVLFFDELDKISGARHG
jgi:hypothetical protein